MPDRSANLVENAADPKQVQRARRKEKDRDERFIGSLRAVLSTPDGRTVCREWIQRAGVFESVRRMGRDYIDHLIGRQEFGREMVDYCVQADEDLYELMNREYRAGVKAEERENAAMHTARTEESE